MKTLHNNSRIDIALTAKVSKLEDGGVLHAIVIADTEKAVRIQALADNDKSYTLWLPKKALAEVEGDEQALRLHSWFTPNGFGFWFLRHCAVAA